MKTLLRGLKVLWGLAGLMFILFLLVGFLGLPKAWVMWMTGGDSALPPGYRYVVVMGGAGIPSESGLIRTYHGAALAAGKKGVTCVVALPCDIAPERGSVGKMRNELVLRGVSPRSVVMEYRGINTHEQAVNIAHLLGPASLTDSVVVVTSPLHIRRSVMCFRHEGFRNITGFAATSGDVEADIGSHTLLRYSFWGNLAAGLGVLREGMALGQYWVKGWI